MNHHQPQSHKNQLEVLCGFSDHEGKCCSPGLIPLVANDSNGSVYESSSSSYPAVLTFKPHQLHDREQPNTKAILKKKPQFIAIESLSRYRIATYLMAYR